MNPPANFHEVIIVGGGPAGLSAALVLARCRRQVLVIDSGKPRNWASHSVGGFFTRDGTHPKEMLRLGREELGAYHCVKLLDGEVTAVTRIGERFHVVVRGEAQPFQCRRLLLATGLVDELPPHRRHPAVLRQQRVPLPDLQRLGGARPAARRLRHG